MTNKKASAGEHLVKFFNQLTYEKIDELDAFYAEEVEFRDPVQEFSTRSALKKYLAKQYKNTISCKFEPLEIIGDGRKSSIRWVMHLRHKYLNLGREIKLEGVTLVEENAAGKVIAHRDYFDVSAFVLKSLPGADLVKGFFSR